MENEDSTRRRLQLVFTYSQVFSIVSWITWFISSVVQGVSHLCVVCFFMIVAGTMAMGLVFFANPSLLKEKNLRAVIVLSFGAIVYAVDPTTRYFVTYHDKRKSLDRDFVFTTSSALCAAVCLVVMLLTQLLAVRAVTKGRLAKIDPAVGPIQPLQRVPKPAVTHLAMTSINALTNH